MMKTSRKSKSQNLIALVVLSNVKKPHFMSYSKKFLGTNPLANTWPGSKSSENSV
jgi:hypothetical protein